MYPVPWARDASASFPLTENETRTALEEAGYKAILWRDDTEVALDWFKTVMAAQGQTGPNLGLVMGPDFPAKTSNLVHNLRENRLGVLSAVLIRDEACGADGELKETAPEDRFLLIMSPPSRKS